MAWHRRARIRHPGPLLTAGEAQKRGRASIPLRNLTPAPVETDRSLRRLRPDSQAAGQVFRDLTDTLVLHRASSLALWGQKFPEKVKSPASLMGPQTGVLGNINSRVQVSSNRKRLYLFNEKKPDWF